MTTTPSPTATPQAVKRILILGKGSGRTWMRSVIFERKSPLDLVLLDRRPSSKLHITPIRNTLAVDVWDLPGDVNLATDDSLWFLPHETNEAAMWKTVGAIVVVLDAQEDLRQGMIHDMLATMKRAKQANQDVTLEVFINKVDGDIFATEDARMEIYQSFQRQISREMLPQGELENDIAYHLTSVYNPSIFEAWSLVLQKLFPHQTTISALLDVFIEAGNVEKAFLFDTSTRLNMATDHNPVDQQTLMLCGEVLDVVGELEHIYTPGSVAQPPFEGNRQSGITVRLSHDMLLIAHEVGFRLALVCVIRGDSYTRPALFERNVALFTEALHHVLAMSA